MLNLRMATLLFAAKEACQSKQSLNHPRLRKLYGPIGNAEVELALEETLRVFEYMVLCPTIRTSSVRVTLSLEPYHAKVEGPRAIMIFGRVPSSKIHP